MPKFLEPIRKTLVRAGYTVQAGTTAVSNTAPQRYVPLMKRMLRYGFETV